jgi:hypothetical protein
VVETQRYRTVDLLPTRSATRPSDSLSNRLWGIALDGERHLRRQRLADRLYRVAEGQADTLLSGARRRIADGALGRELIEDRLANRFERRVARLVAEQPLRLLNAAI